jgi:hypothetical protein
MKLLSLDDNGLLTDEANWNRRDAAAGDSVAEGRPIASSSVHNHGREPGIDRNGGLCVSLLLDC